MPATSRRSLGGRVAVWLPIVIVAAVTVPPLRGLWLTQGAPMEEGFMLVFPELVMDGQVPNRDFLHLYGPGSLWVLAAAYAVFGVHLRVERSVGYLQVLGLSFGVYRVLRPWGRWVAAGGGAIAGLVVLPSSGLSAMAWVGAVALGVWAVALAIEASDDSLPARARGRRAVVAGLLVGAALLYRLDLVLALVLAGWAVWRSLPPPSRKRLLLGAAAGLSPYLLHLAMAGPMNTIEGLVLEPVLELRGGRRLPIPPSTDRYDGFLQGAGALDPPDWPLPRFSGPRQLWLWFFALLLTGVILLVAGILARRRTGDRRMLTIAAFSVGLFPQALQRPDSTHLAWVACVAFAVLPAALIELHQWARTRSRPPDGSPVGPPGILAGGLAVATPLLLLLVATSDYTYRPYVDMTAKSVGVRSVEAAIDHRGRTFPYKREDAVDAVREMLPVVDELTESGDRLVVGPGDLRKTPYSEAFLYHLLPDLVPGTRYIEMDPGVANADDSELTEEIERADVVILSTIRDDWNEPNDSRLFGPSAPNEALARSFCLHDEYGIGPFDPDRGLYELYLRC